MSGQVAMRSGEDDHHYTATGLPSWKVGLWTFIASENQSFSVSGTQLVRYGNEWVAWVQKSVTGPGQCSNAFFGSDPAPGKGKVCELQSAAVFRRGAVVLPSVDIDEPAPIDAPDRIHGAETGQPFRKPL